MPTIDEQLDTANAEVSRLLMLRASATCREVGSCDMQSIGGANCGCPDGACSVPVLKCTRCGDTDYGENDDARAKRAECAASRDIPDGVYWSQAHSNFYDEDRGCGTEFYKYWRSRMGEFPQCDCQMVPTHISNDCPIHG